MNQESLVPNNDKETTSEAKNVLNSIKSDPSSEIQEGPINLGWAAECIGQCNDSPDAQCYQKCMDKKSR